MTNNAGFLEDLSPRSPRLSPQHGIEPFGLCIGRGGSGLEVVIARTDTKPRSAALLDIWKERRGSRAAPVLLAVLHSEGAALCGPLGENPPIHLRLDRSSVENLCREALARPDRHMAVRFLKDTLPSLEAELPGIHNEGLVALHALQSLTSGKFDLDKARRKAAEAAEHRDRALLVALGFKIRDLDNNLTHMLSCDERQVALAVILHETESPDAGATRFNGFSPVSYALAKATDLAETTGEAVRWVVLVQGNSLRLYATDLDVGVGRRGRTETFLGCQLTVLSREHLYYLWLIYSGDALVPGGTLDQILDDSKRFAGDLAERLRERIYYEVVPTLARGVATARNLDQPTTKELDLTYEMTLTVLFRLLFIAYAEDRDLLPYRSNDAYRARSLKTKAQEFAARIDDEVPVSSDIPCWDEVLQLWRAVEEGREEWGVPAYDGGLFSEDPEVFPAGAELAKISLPNETFEKVLRALLVIEATREGVPGPVDFRSLGVREFGTIYEGLLESELALAETDLTINKQNAYVPARESDAVEIRAGEVYLHNRSGARKSSGSYYTKQFAVEHLLDGALEPAINDHFKRLESLGDGDAAKAFFDFKVADIAMGSGHFLIAAIDHIEKRMADFLTTRKLDEVIKRLKKLRGAAKKELSGLAGATVIDDSQLLRRMIARRCIYGVDINPLGVQLARLSVWIHTFVPGLPLSMLDHTLVHGDSLVGVGTIEDIRRKFEQASDRSPLWNLDPDGLLGEAKELLRKIIDLNDETVADVKAGRKAHQEVEEVLGPTRALCDLIAASAVSDDEKVQGFLFEEWEERAADPETKSVVEIARRELADLHPLHFPVAFPEVFLREHPGFDVLLGNPPWEKVKVEEHGFWARHFPGFRSLPTRERELERRRLQEERPDLMAALETELTEKKRMRRALVNGDYPGIGQGDPDLYKAFCWRFWRLIRTGGGGGHSGVVLPRSALSAQGSAEFRHAVFKGAAYVETNVLVNRGSWVFDEVTPQYTIALVCIARGVPEEKSIRLHGPYFSGERFAQDAGHSTAAFSYEEVLSWNDSAALPLLPSEHSIEIFTQLRNSPRLDMNEANEWRVRPDTELHATGHRSLMDTESEGYWPIYKGESFDHWCPDTGKEKYYAYADPSKVVKRLQERRQSPRSNHREFSTEHLRDPQTLPCFFPRIAFRDVARATDRRTIIPCLVPPQVFITHLAPYFLWPHGDEQDQAYLLGILSSIPCDWYARRFVETHLVFYLLNSFPVPRPSRDAPGWQRVVELSGRLACPDERFAAWAETVGVECGPLPDDEKEDMIHELDAVVAHLYGLSESQLVHIFETFHETWDYHARLEGVLRHFRAWNGRT